jgi:hypothetical protein
MRITKNPTLDLETLEWVANDGIEDYLGPLVLFQSTSGAASANEKAQAAFYKQMTQEQQTAFGEDQSLLADIQQQTLPILAKGPEQFGYSPQLDALLQSYIKSSGATATASSINATELQQRQATGGAPAPEGSNAEIEAVANTLGNQSTASNLINEKLSGYQAGQQLYTQALGALTSEQSLLNPAGYAGAATGAGNAATGAINLADSERSNLLQTVLGGAVGGLTTAATGGLSAGLGTAASKIGSGDFGW